MSQNMRPIKNIEGVVLSLSQKKDKNCGRNFEKRKRKKEEQRATKSIKFTKEKIRNLKEK
jgi:hypothetical protein